MVDAMKFWLPRGVARFRLDAIPTLFEDAHPRDEPELAGTNDQGDPNLKEIYIADLPEVHDVRGRLREMVDRFPGDRVLIGERTRPDTAALDAWYGGAERDELQLPMDMLVGFGDGVTAGASYFRHTLDAAETQLHGSQPLIVRDNHDNIQSIDRMRDSAHRARLRSR